MPQETWLNLGAGLWGPDALNPKSETLGDS
jgi:hypothetical protein